MTASQKLIDENKFGLVVTLERIDVEKVRYIIRQIQYDQRKTSISL